MTTTPITHSMLRKPLAVGLLAAAVTYLLLTSPAVGQEAPDAGVVALDFAPAVSGVPVAVRPKPAVLLPDPELPPPADDYEAKGRAVLEAVDKGDGWMAAALLLSLLVLVSRKAGAWWLPDGAAVGEPVAWKVTVYTRLGMLKRWVASGEGAVVLTVVGALLSGAISTHTAGVPVLSWLGIKAVIKVAVAALGGFAGLQHTLGSKAAESRAERREITGAIKAGAQPAPTVAP